MNEDMKPKAEWLKEYAKAGTKRVYSSRFDEFCKWAHTSDEELVTEYKTSDPREFAKKWGKKIIQFYNVLLKDGYKINTARSKTVPIRAFLKSQCIEAKVKKGAIAKAQIALREHEFRLDELQRMYRIGDIYDKAKLSVAIALGWGVSDVLSLKWSFVEPFLQEDLEPPIAFWYERGKTHAPSRSHLTHEAIASLRSLRRLEPDAEYVFSGQNGHLHPDTMNDWLKSLVSRAGIEPRGKVRFHLLRKFLMSQLSASGMNQWETKLVIGKSVDPSILTYLKDQTENLRTKYKQAEPRFTLTGYTNTNHGKIDQLTEEVKELRQAMRTIAKYVRLEMERNGAFATLPPNDRATLNRLTIMGTGEEEDS